MKAKSSFAALQKTYDQSHLKYSYAVHFENLGNETEALRCWRQCLAQLQDGYSSLIASSHKPRSESEKQLLRNYKALRTQCEERVALLQALLVSQVEAENAGFGSSGAGGDGAAMGVPLSPPVLPVRPNTSAELGTLRSLDSRGRKSPSPSPEPRPFLTTLRPANRKTRRQSEFIEEAKRPRAGPEAAAKAASMAWTTSAVGLENGGASGGSSAGSSTVELPVREGRRPSIRSEDREDGAGTPTVRRMPGAATLKSRPHSSVPPPYPVSPSHPEPGRSYRDFSAYPPPPLPTQTVPPAPPPPPHRVPVASVRMSRKPLPREYTEHPPLPPRELLDHAQLQQERRPREIRPPLPPKAGTTGKIYVETQPTDPVPTSSRSRSHSERPAPTVHTHTPPASPQHYQPPTPPDADHRSPTTSSLSSSSPPPTTRIEEALSSLPPSIDPAAARQVANEILHDSDTVHWNDIAGLDAAKSTLKETVVYPFLRPDLFLGLREPARGLLLFGPPGTGKTMLARAVATESRSTFFAISASSLTSKYLGESEKLVRALFALAKTLAPSIIFVDEIDSLLSARGGQGEHEATTRIKTEFLIQWSALARAAASAAATSPESRVLVLAATNLPWAIDDAARRRFVRRQYIPLPEADTRKTQIAHLLAAQNHTLTDDEMRELVALTDGFSGSDITALAKDAAMGPLRELGERLLEVGEGEIRGIEMRDFRRSLESIRPSVSKEGLKRFEEWAEKFGERGG